MKRVRSVSKKHISATGGSNSSSRSTSSSSRRRVKRVRLIHNNKNRKDSTISQSNSQTTTTSGSGGTTTTSRGVRTSSLTSSHLNHKSTTANHQHHHYRKRINNININSNDDVTFLNNDDWSDARMMDDSAAVTTPSTFDYNDDRFGANGGVNSGSTKRSPFALIARDDKLLIRCFSYLTQECLFKKISSLSRKMYSLTHSSECWRDRCFYIFFTKQFDKSGVCAQNKFLRLIELQVELGGIECKNSTSIKTICQLLLDSKSFLHNSLRILKISGNGIDGISFEQFSDLLLFPNLHTFGINSVVGLEKYAERGFSECLNDWSSVRELPVRHLYFRPTFWKFTKEQVETFMNIFVPKLTNLDSLDCGVTCIQHSKEESGFFKIRMGNLLLDVLQRISVLSLALSRYVKHSWKVLDENHKNNKLKVITLRSARTKDLLLACNTKLLDYCTTLTLEQAPKDITDELFDQLSKLLGRIDEFEISCCSFAFSSTWLTTISNNMPDLTKMHFKLTSWFGASKDWNKELAQVKSVKYLSMDDCHCLPPTDVICRLFPSLETLVINSVPVEISKHKMTESTALQPAY